MRAQSMEFSELNVEYGYCYQSAAVVPDGSTALAVAVGVSRVVNGVHYPSDIAGGWAVGVGVGMLTLRWGRCAGLSPRPRQPPDTVIPGLRGDSPVSPRATAAGRCRAADDCSGVRLVLVRGFRSRSVHASRPRLPRSVPARTRSIPR